MDRLKVALLFFRNASPLRPNLNRIDYLGMIISSFLYILLTVKAARKEEFACEITSEDTFDLVDILSKDSQSIRVNPQQMGNQLGTHW